MIFLAGRLALESEIEITIFTLLASTTTTTTPSSPSHTYRFILFEVLPDLKYPVRALLYSIFLLLLHHPSPSFNKSLSSAICSAMFI